MQVTRSKSQSREGPRLPERTREAITGYLCALPWMLGLLLFTVGPMAYSLGLSLFKSDMLRQAKFVGLQNYIDLVHDELVIKALRNTAFYAFISVPLGTTLALFVALLLNQKVPGVSVFRTIFYLPSVVSGVAVAVLWLWLLHPYFGLINTTLRLLFGIQGPMWLQSEQWAMPSLILMSQWGIGGSMIIFLAGLQEIPESLYEAASIDGAGQLDKFWNITVPMMTPTLFFSIIMGLIGSFQVFTSSYIMTSGGPNNATLTYVLLIYRKAFEQFHFGYASALAWVFFWIVLALTLVVIKSSAAWVYYAGELRK